MGSVSLPRDLTHRIYMLMDKFRMQAHFFMLDIGDEGED